MTLNLFPLPRRCSIRKTPIDLSESGWIVLPLGADRALRERLMQCASRIAVRLGKPVRVGAVLPAGAQLLLEIHTDARAHGPQSFELVLDSRSRRLTGGDEAGAFYGCLAFTQLIEQFGSTPPSVRITDGPDFPVRGVMLDVSRCKVPTLATLKQLIDRLAELRINQLQLYTEHTFAFAAHQIVWRDASPITHEDILELDQYCADRFIELVPNLNSFGHMSRWLRHPAYRALAECPQRDDTDCLAPNSASLKFLQGLYEEMLPQFSSRLFNVGCDETWELGKGRSKRQAEKTSTTQVYLQFIQRIHKLCAKMGRRMSFWGDIILHEPGLISELPQDVLALCWGYEADHPYDKQCRAFAEAGIEYHVCPGTSSWNSITGRTDNALANLQSAAHHGLRHGATGYLNTDWGDGGHYQVLPISYVGFAGGAAYSWCLKANRDVDLAGALDRIFFDDRSGRLGEFCLELGRTPNRLPGLVRHNCSAIDRLLFWNGDPQRLDLSRLTKAQFDRADAFLKQLSKQLNRARPGAQDGELVMNELRHTLAMSHHALARGRIMHLGQGDAKKLNATIKSLVKSHQQQWLARNRPGGLAESTAKLQKSRVG